MIRAECLALLLVTLATPALAEVKSADDNGFTIESSVPVAATPAEVVAAIGEVGRWWEAEHSYSGKAANMTMDLRPGGCFCEALLGGGGVEHARVVYVDRAGGIVRLRGGLGPMQTMGVDGALSFVAKPAAKGSTLTMTYAAGGHFPGGAKPLAPIVDKVMGEQIASLAAWIARRPH